MWEDIKRWILSLYCLTGLMFGIITLEAANATLEGFSWFFYIVICIFCWLPIVVVGFFLDILMM
jgi:apolipoprotein N-acyltransferase